MGSQVRNRKKKRQIAKDAIKEIAGRIPQDGDSQSGSEGESETKSNSQGESSREPHQSQGLRDQAEDAESPSAKAADESVAVSKIRKNKDKELKKKLYQSRRVTFILGAVLGLLATIVITAMSSEDIKGELDKLMRYDSFNEFMEDWRDSIPQGLQLILDGNDRPKSNELKGSAESFSVGKRMQHELNLTSKYNVVMVPGVISTGLESWGTNDEGPCPSLPHFRKRLWGLFYMLRTMVLDKACWLKHVKLDPETGLDPPNIKVRALSGFDAADFFVAGYWIWNKILQNLAVIGYGPENMISAGYDWRLAYLDLERRDGYFTKLRLQIETTKRLTGQKSYLVGHSMGLQVIYYFMKWVEAEGPFYGNGGKLWCNDHLAGFIDISGSLLGTPKAIPALLSGEMKDTVQLNYFAVYGLEKFFSKKERVEMLRTFGGIPAMIPKGGDSIWGNLTSSPDDPGNTLSTSGVDAEMSGPKNDTVGKFVRYRGEAVDTENGLDPETDYTVVETIDRLLKVSPEWFSKRVRDNYSFGLAKTAEELRKNELDHTKWSNPLEVALPNAPDMKIFSFYGVGNPTERAYTYRKGGRDAGIPYVIDTESDHPVYFGDGDGTLALMTHSICHEWQRHGLRFNPANIEVKIVEIKHEPDRFDIRGGAKTAEHVDILGSAELNELVLKVVGGLGHTIDNVYVSDLRNITSKLGV